MQQRQQLCSQLQRSRASSIGELLVHFKSFKIHTLVCTELVDYLVAAMGA